MKVEDSLTVKDGAVWTVGITPQLEGAGAGAGWQHPSFAVASPEVLSRLLIFKRRASPAPTSNLHLLHLPPSKLVQKPTRRPLLIFRLFLTGHGLTDRRTTFCPSAVLPAGGARAFHRIPDPGSIRAVCLACLRSSPTCVSFGLLNPCSFAPPSRPDRSRLATAGQARLPVAHDHRRSTNVGSSSSRVQQQQQATRSVNLLPPARQTHTTSHAHAHTVSPCFKRGIGGHAIASLLNKHKLTRPLHPSRQGSPGNPPLHPRAIPPDAGGTSRTDLPVLGSLPRG